MQKFSVVVHRRGKELYRSVGMAFEQALRKAKEFNRGNQDHSWGAESAYVEETFSVKHLPVVTTG